eukprot:scaffold49_cov115-Isochrysis_galbana.AAC.3
MHALQYAGQEIERATNRFDPENKISRRRDDASMASSAGPRAMGTDGGDHKFRQRVDNHYQLMADGRARLGQACKAHLAGSLTLLGSVAAAAGLAGDDGPATATLVVLGAPALLGAYLGNLGRGAGKMTEAASASFSRLNAALALLLLALACYMAVHPQEQLVLAAALAGGFFALVGCLLAARGASGLRAGFASQAEKKRGAR